MYLCNIMSDIKWDEYWYYMYFHLSISKMFTAQVSRGFICLTAAPYYVKIAGCYVAINFLRLLIELLCVVFNYK